MKRLNIKLLVILLITVVVLSTGVAVVHAIQMNRNSDSLIKRAETAKSSGDTTQAIWYYRRYLAYKPQDLERYAEYALLTAGVAESPGSTFQEYSGALRDLQNVLLNDRGRHEGRLNDKSRSDVRHKLIDLEMATRQAPLIDAARKLLLEMKAKGETTPQDDLKLAKCQGTMGNYLDAVKILEPAVGYDPAAKTFDAKKATAADQVDAYIMLASLLRDKITDVQISDRQEVADHVMDQLVAVNKDSAKAFLGQARYLQRYYSRDKAKPALEQAMKLAPNDSEVLTQAAEMATQAQDYKTANSLIQKGIDEHPKEDRLYLGQAMLAKFQDKPKEAKERLEAGLKEIPTSGALLQMLFEMQLEEHDTKAATITMQKLKESNYPPVLKEFREAQLLMLEGDMLEASQRLEKLRPQLGKIGDYLQQGTNYTLQADYMLMQCYMALGFHDLALTTARRLVTEDRGIFEAHLGIAASLMALGKTAESKAEYERLLPLVPASKQKILVPQIANALVRLRIAEQMQRGSESRDWASVQNYMSDLRNRGMLAEPEVSLLQADVLLKKDDKKEAVNLLNQMAKQYPDNATVMRARIELAFDQHNPEEALQLIKSAPESMRGDIALELGRIDAILQLHSKKDDILKELETLSAEVDKGKMSDADRGKMHVGLGLAFTRQGEFDKSLQQFKQAVQAQPRSARIRWMIFNLARDMGNIATLKESTEWFQNEYGRDSSQAKLSEAATLVVVVRDDLRAKAAAGKQPVELSEANKDQLQKAKDLLRTVESLRPEWAERPKVLAEIDVLENKPDEEIIDLREVLRLGASDPLVVKRLAQRLMAQKRYAEVKEVLDTYGNKENVGLERMEAVSDQFVGRPDLALQRLEAAIPKDSPNAGDHLYHGQLLASVGKLKEAEAEIRRATELAPQQPETWLALVYFLTTNGMVDEARKAVQEAEIQLPEDRRTLAIAQGYEMVGDEVMADQQYQVALDAAPKDAKTQRLVAAYYLRNRRYKQATALVDELLHLSPTKASDREILAWARQSKAQLLAAKGDYQSIQKALEFLTPPAGEKATTDELSQRAALLGSRTDAASSRQALNTLTELKERRALTEQERILLAHIYERVGDWSAARDEMVSVLGQPKPSATAYTSMIEMLLRRNSAADAVSWLQKLNSSGQGNPLLIATLASHVMVAQGRGADAAAVLMKILPAERPVPKDKAYLLRVVANTLTQLAQYDSAEKVWRDYVAADPDQMLDLATFLAQRGKVDEALQLAEQRRRSTSPVTILQIAAAAASQQVHPLTAAQAQQIEQWFQKALRDDPDSTPIQVLWCQFLDSQQRYDEMEKVYRAILAKTDLPPNDRAGVANNLAFALAEQGHELDEALKLSQDAMNFFGPVAEVLDTRGMVNLAKGNTTQAIQDFTDAVAVVEPQPAAYVHLAMAQAAARDMSSARKSLDRAKELKLDVNDLAPPIRKKFEALNEQINKPS